MQLDHFQHLRIMRFFCALSVFSIFSVQVFAETTKMSLPQDTPLSESYSDMKYNDYFSERIPLEILFSDQAFTTATRSVQHIHQVTDNVTVITREEIDQWPVSDLDEALGFINGIVVQDDGHLGQVATAQIYGSKPREVRVMVDGITFNPTSTGGIADLSQIPLDIVEKIEIIKGASSSVWGSSMGGVVNVITRSVGNDWKPTIRESSSWGEFRTQRHRSEISGAIGPLRYYTMGSHMQSGGFRPNGDSLEKRGFIKAEIPFTDEVRLQGSFGYSGSKISEFKLPNAGGGVFGDRKVYSRYGNVGLVFHPREDISMDLFYKISERSFRRDIYALAGGSLAPLFGSNGHFRFSKAQSLIHEISLKNVWDISQSQTLVVGSDIGADLYSDIVFTAPLFGVGPYATTLDVDKKNTRHAYYTNYQISWWRFDATLGSRLDATNSFGTEFSPSAGLVFHLPFWNAQFRGNASKAFNTPSFVDRFQSTATVAANPDLKAERAIVYNLGLEADPTEWLHAQSVFFQTFVEDSIQTITRSDGLRQAVNFDSERRTGFESNIRMGPWHGATVSYGVTYVKSVNPGDGPVRGRPHFTQDIKINYGKKFLGMHFNTHLAGRHMDLVTGYGTGDPIDQMFIFDGKVVLTFPKVKFAQLSVFVEGENLFNQDFSFDGTNDSNPQRNFESGFKFTVN